jgi:hypothetical protein
MPSRATAESAPATVKVTAQLSSRTSLRVSNDVLQFEVLYPTQPVVVSVGFVAGARTTDRSPVLLLFEMVEAVRGIDGVHHGDATLTLMNEDGGVITELKPGTPATARRWVGSGQRAGRLLFALRAETAGRYRVPMRLTLTAP